MGIDTAASGKAPFVVGRLFSEGRRGETRFAAAQGRLDIGADFHLARARESGHVQHLWIVQLYRGSTASNQSRLIGMEEPKQMAMVHGRGTRAGDVHKHGDLAAKLSD
ncbi:hypothetical protein PENSPDRAFT_82444 [Peniophora sp. CONT]|nr:hypothetical protein PENSPDRAFT_82444 [Peniophora sp. CONT]